MPSKRSQVTKNHAIGPR